MQEQANRYEVSIIVPTYNSSRLLGYTLTSLAKQDAGKDRFEVIVADDGSTDDTRHMVGRYADALNLKYVYQEDRGYRPGSARNMGICRAEGRICIFIDSSVILNTDCVTEHIRFYEKRSENASAIGYVYGFDQCAESESWLRELVIPDNPYESVQRLSGHDAFRDVREAHYAAHRHEIHGLPAPWVFFWTCHVSVQRKDLIRIGMFDEKYDGRWGMEDFDLGFRLHQAGVGIFLLKSAEAIHYPHPKDMTERKRQGYQNCCYFNEKFGTFETDLYYRNYHHIETIDVNAMCLQLQQKTL